MSNTITIERTSKSLKGQLVLCGMLFWLVAPIWAMCSWSYGDTNDVPPDYTKPICIAVFAVFWYFVTKIRIWWNHG